MPLQNRVTPMAEIIAAPERGSFTGNRGILHDARTRTLMNRRWTSRAWLICTLKWRKVRRTIMGAGWTELFFLDEATALAAGHRPCFFCRRAEAKAFQAAFPTDRQTPMPAHDIDKVLHAERLDGRQKRLHDLASAAADLPDGAMIFQENAAHLVLEGWARRWSLGGYGPPIVPVGHARLITPPSTVTALKAGYRPRIHPSASDSKTGGRR